MESVSEIEKQIEAVEGELVSVKKEIQAAAVRLKEAQDSAENLKRTLTDKKAQRQQALAKGENVSTLNADIKRLEGEAELTVETIKGIERLLSELRSREDTLIKKPEDLKKRILQIQSIGLAERYNAVAGELAEIVRELNAIYYKLTGNGNNKENAVVFYPLEGCFEKMPKIFYDAEGLNLEAFVAKHPGLYHNNNHLAASEKNYYDWFSHQNRLRS